MDYEKMTILQLRQVAKDRGIKKITALHKAPLIERLKKYDEENEKSAKDTADDRVVTSEGVEMQLIKASKPVKGKEEASKKEEVSKNEKVPEKEETSKKEENSANENKENKSNSQGKDEDKPKVRKLRPLTAAEVTQNMVDAVAKITQDEDMAESIRSQFIELGTNCDIRGLDSGETKTGILEIMPEGYGFIRCDNYLPGINDVYVSPQHIRKFNLKTGDMITGNTRVKNPIEKFAALLYIRSVNGHYIKDVKSRPKFEDLTPIFPNKRLYFETKSESAISMRMLDLIAPVGKGQRGMIVSQPKAGKTTLLKQIAHSIIENNPDMHLIILLIDERPEEVTDMKDSIKSDMVEIIYSTFDETPDNHRRVSEMVIERAKRLVEHKKDVIVLLDSITRLARAYNITVTPSGRTLSGGLDPAALHMPKRFFGAARNMREGGSLTILATALVETGSRMDDVVFEEFKGTGNMELVLDRSLSEKRIFPAIDLAKSSTRRDDLLFTSQEAKANEIIKKTLSTKNSDDTVESIIRIFKNFRTNAEVVSYINRQFGDKKLIR